MSSLLDIYNNEVQSSTAFSEQTKKSLLEESNTLQNKLKDPTITNQEREQLLNQKNKLYESTDYYKANVLKKDSVKSPLKTTERSFDPQVEKDAAEYSQAEAIGYATRLGALDTFRGIQQITGFGAESAAYDQKVLNRLMENPDWGWQVRSAYIGGLFVDPAGWIIPFAKARSIGKMAYYGAISGGITSAASYVDEDVESLVSNGKLTRTEQTLIGVAGGATIAPALGGIRNAYRYTRGKDLIPLVEKNISEVKPKGSYKKIVDLDRLGDPVRSSVNKRTAGIVVKHDSNAKATNSINKTKNKVSLELENGKPKLKKLEYKPSTLVQNTMYVKDMFRKYAFGKTADIERWQNASNNPGAYIGAVGGATVGWTTAEEDANVLEKLGNVMLYTALGLVSGKEFPKFVKTAANKYDGNPNSVKDYMGRMVIDRYNIRNFKEYQKARAKFGYESGHLAGKLLKIVRDDLLKLKVEDRVLIYKMLTGEAPVKGDKLPELTDRIRKEISILSQNMIDEGLIDAETVRKNADTYLHQVYQLYRKSPTKLTGGEKKLIKQLNKTQKDIKLIGDNLRPRGFTLDVTQKQYDNFYKKQTVGSNLKEINKKMGLDEIFKERGVKAVARKEDVGHKGWEILGKSKTKPGKITIRWQYSKAQREAMGEVEDGALVVAETARLLGNNIAAKRFLQDVADKYAIPEKAFKRSNLNRDEWQLISKADLIETDVKQFGPLAGQYIPKAMYEDIRGITGVMAKGDPVNNFLKDSDFFKYANNINTYWKLSKTAYNPVVHTNNFMSNIMLLYFSNSSFTSLGEAFRTMGNRKNNKIFEVMKRYGSLDVNFIDQEIRDTKHYSNYFNAQAGVYQNINDVVTAGKKGISSTINSASKIFNKNSAIRRPFNFMEDLYKSEDSVFRIAVFRDRLKKALDGRLEFQRLSGKQLSESDKTFIRGLLNNTDDADLDLFKVIHKDPQYKRLAEVFDAAHTDAKRWFIDYDIQAPAIQLLRRTALPFIGYTYRAVPLLMEAAIKYPHKFAAIAIIGSAYDHVIGTTTPENEAKERALMPERYQGEIYLPFMPDRMTKVPNFRDHQTPTYLDITRWVPGGDVFDVKHGSGILPGIPASFQPSFGAYGSLYNSFMGWDPYLGQEVPGMGAGGWSSVVGNITKEFLPNNPLVYGSYSFNKVFEALSGKYENTDLTDIGFPLNGKSYQDSPVRDRIPVMQAIASVFGIKLIPANMEKLSNKKRFELEKRLADFAELGSIYRKKLDKGQMNEKTYLQKIDFIKNKRRKLIQDFGEVLDMPSKDEDQLENGAFLYQTQKQIIDKYKSIEDFIIQIEKENGNWNKNFQTGQ